MFGLLLDGQIAVDDADAARLRHGDGQRRFRHRVHGRGDQRDGEFNGLGEAGAGIDLSGEDLGGRGHQEHIVEGEGFANVHGICSRLDPLERRGFISESGAAQGCVAGGSGTGRQPRRFGQEPENP